MKGPFQLFQPGSTAIIRGVGLILLLGIICTGLLTASAQRKSRQGLKEPVYRVPTITQAQQPPVARQAAVIAPRQPAANGAVSRQAAPARLVSDTKPADEHPLAPFVKRTTELLERMDANVKDYSAQLVKRENIDGQLGPSTYMEAKVRHEQRNAKGEIIVPFSVYLHFVAPDDVKGREVLWVKDRNDNKLTAHDGGTGLLAALKSSVTVNLDPDSSMAMKGNKYPIYNIGMRNLLVKLREEAQKDTKYDEIEVKVFKNTKINGRVCTCLQSVHPKKRSHFRYHIARVYIDDELQLPIRYEAYDWPRREGEAPQLQEEYTYVNVKLNNGFTDTDFSSKNPRYRFN